MEMSWRILFILAGSFLPVWSTAPSNCSTRPVDVSGTDGVCKADYGARFNIDSKELGNTCVTKGRGRNLGSKPLSLRLRQALDRMKQDFEQLQELIDQEAMLVDSEPVGSSLWKSGALSVHREYSQKDRKGPEKGPLGDTLSSESRDLPEVRKEENSLRVPSPFQPISPESSRQGPDTLRSENDLRAQTLFKSPQVSLFGTRSDGFSYNDPLQLSRSHTNNFPMPPNQFLVPQIGDGLNFNSKDSREPQNPSSDYNARQPFNAQRVLADIRLDPQITQENNEVKNKNAEPEEPAQSGDSNMSIF